MLAAAVAAVTLAAPATSLAQPDPGVEAVQRDLELQERILRDPNSTQQQREEAARKLVSRDAEQILLRQLSDAGSRDVQVAVARALALDPTPNPEFIQPLLRLLGQDAVLTEASAMALATFKNNGAVRDRLIGFVENLNNELLSRRAVVRALGRLVDKVAADKLIALLNKRDENPRIRDAAAEALEQMTGLSYGADPQRWNQWWSSAGNLSDEDWALDRALRSAGQITALDSRLQSMRESVYRITAAQYRQKYEAEATRPRAIAELLQHMSDPSEDVRWAAVQVVYDEAGVRTPPQIAERLRAMVGDSSAMVREQVALTLGAVNDQAAVDALLTQAAQERNPDVLSAIISALGPASQLRGDFQTVEAVLHASLDHESFAVARAAAESLKALARTLQDPKNKAAADTVARHLHDRLRTTDRNLAALKLRESIVEALQDLAHPTSVPVFQQLLRPGGPENPTVRVAALRGLKSIGNPDTAQSIVNVLNNDLDKGVRYAAADALLTTARYANINAIYPRLSERVEPDVNVRDMVWKVMAGLFEQAEPKQLDEWAQAFNDKKNPTEKSLSRRLLVLNILEKKLAAGGRQEQLAITHQNLGETLLKIGRAEDASLKFIEALGYWNKQDVPPFFTHMLVIQTMESLLQAKKDAEAVAFATEAIGRNPPREGDLWSAVKTEVDRRTMKGDIEGALSLVQQVRKVPWIAMRGGQLDATEKDLLQGRTGSTSRIVHEPKIHEHAAVRVHAG